MRRGLILVVLGVSLVLLTAVRSLAQDAQGFVLDPNEPAASAKAGKVLRAYRVTAEAPRIDASLEDEVWRHAQVAGELVQWEPDNMSPLSEATSMQVAYDDRFLYVAIRCDDRTPDLIAAGLGRRDEFPPTDTVGIGFDPRHDHQTGYVFATNPSGVQSDVYFFDDDNADRDFNAVWEVRAAVTDKGWVAEFRIPFSQLRFTASPDAGQVWGFGIRRTIRRRSETGEWTGKPRGERGEVSRWGHLVFDASIRPPRRIEWQPYVLGGGTRVPEGANDLDTGAGVDLRVGIGTSATLSATVNPDFAQVEQDPSVLNLTVFETFFPEKRPFFLEDSRTFAPPYGIFQVFHSRRIGRRPDRFDLADGETERDRPDQTTILGAAKLTGKASKLTYGALTALTSSESAEVSVASASGKAQRLVEPLSSYNVVRLQRDVGASSNVGVIATGVFRDRDRDAFTGGFDYNLKWDRNRASVNGHWVATRAPVDGTMKAGYGGVSNFNFSRKHFNVFSHFDHFDRGFKISDMGFFRSRANRTELNGGFGLEQPDPWRFLRSASMFFNAGQGWNDERLILGRFMGGGGFLTFKNFWSMGSGLFHGFQTFDDLDTRGGPPILSPAGNSMFFFVESDSRKAWRANVGANADWNEAGGWGARVGPELSVQPSARLQASVSTNVNVARDHAQWIENTDTDGDGTKDHVYGTLKRHVVDMTFRATYAIQRDLTLQVFLQPFVAVGEYTDVRRLARPRSYEFAPATLADNPDFNNKSVRGNIVLRWEYIRGSTLFVAWNMSASDDARPGVFRFSRDIRDAFRAPGTHAVLVKVSYWLSR
ncbi:MAG: DUF5916 domain-containing protein [Vicinamibacterales bacterium]